MTTTACVDDRAAEALVVRSCVKSLRVARIDNDRVRSALAELERWLVENDPRWNL